MRSKLTHVNVVKLICENRSMMDTIFYNSSFHSLKDIRRSSSWTALARNAHWTIHSRRLGSIWMEECLVDTPIPIIGWTFEKMYVNAWYTQICRCLVSNQIYSYGLWSRTTRKRIRYKELHFSKKGKFFQSTFVDRTTWWKLANIPFLEVAVKNR